jgi:hypothetical protein
MLSIHLTNVTETSVHQFATDASELGLAPGNWPPPAKLLTSLGNGMHFVRTTYTGERATYHQSFGCIELAIFND